VILTYKIGGFDASQCKENALQLKNLLNLALPYNNKSLIDDKAFEVP